MFYILSLYVIYYTRASLRGFHANRGEPPRVSVEPPLLPFVIATVSSRRREAEIFRRIGYCQTTPLHPPRSPLNELRCLRSPKQITEGNISPSLSNF